MIEAYCVDLLPNARLVHSAQAMDLDLTKIRQRNIATALTLEQTKRAYLPKLGYIAGTADGIVTVGGVPASREILVMDAQSQACEWVARLYSLKNGHYLIDDLDVDKRYLILCRPIYGLDDQGITPAVWDNITPANDLTIDEQQALWQSWQV